MRTEKANAVRSQESSRSALKGLVGAVVLGGLLVIAAPGAAHGQDQGCQANEFAKLLPSDGGSGDAFGWRVAIAGDIAVVAAYLDGAGSAYVFMWDGSTWTLAAKLVPADGASGDGFGCSVAISGDTVVVGSYRDDGDTGAVYIFEKGVAWVDGSTNQATKLTACDGEAGDVFGASVALCGDTIVIGAP